MDVKKVVLDSHTKLMAERNIDKISSPEMEIRPKNGIDSLGIVNMILDIEETLHVELDSFLPRIRKCRTIGQLIEIVEEAVAKKRI